MRKLLLTIALYWFSLSFGQIKCQLDVDVTDSLGVYKATKQRLVYERSFAGNSTTIFFTLSSNNGLLALDMVYIQRSDDFIKASCFDKNSKLYLQLNNGKIATLLYVGEGSCGSLVRDQENKNTRVLSGTFVFSKENFEDLKLSPVTFVRVNFSGENFDFPLKSELIALNDGKKTEPEKYFIENLGCFN